MPGPFEEGVTTTLGTLKIVIIYDLPGIVMGNWTIGPTGTFSVDGPEPPDHPQLMVSGSSVRPDPANPSRVMLLRWESDRPVRVTANATPGAPTFTCPEDEELPHANSGWRFQTSGELYLRGTCPGTTYTVDLALIDEERRVASYDQNLAGAPSHGSSGGAARPSSSSSHSSSTARSARA